MMFNQELVPLKMRELIIPAPSAQLKINWLIKIGIAHKAYDSGVAATGKAKGRSSFQPMSINLICFSGVTGMMPKYVHAYCHFENGMTLKSKISVLI